jgi:hypothetical protein
MRTKIADLGSSYLVEFERDFQSAGTFLPIWLPIFAGCEFAARKRGAAW